MAKLRTEAGEAAYLHVRAQRGLQKEHVCYLCADEPLQQFKYWKILPAAFPYDKLAKVHHLILPIRHVTEEELTKEEHEELLALKSGYVNDHYEYIIEGTHSKKTIPHHFHLHLIVIKELA